MKSESGPLPHNNVKVNGCHHSTCMMFRFTDQFECKPDIIVNRKCPFLPHLPGYIVHVIASFTLLALLRCSLFLWLMRQLLFLLGIQTSTSVLSWSSLLPAFKWMSTMNRQCWAVPQWESDTMGGQKKRQWELHRRVRSAAGEARGSSWTPTLAISSSSLGLLMEDNQELKSITQIKTVTYCVIWIVSETTGQQSCTDLQVNCIVPSLGDIQSIQNPICPGIPE